MNGGWTGLPVNPSEKMGEFRIWLETPRNMQTFAISCAFALVFPVYFAWAPSMLGDGIIGGDSSGATGDWELRFNQTSVLFEEDVNLGNGDTHEAYFDIEDHPMMLTLAKVEVEVICNDNDDPGPGFNDRGSGESDLSGVSGDFTDESADGACNGGQAFSMVWDVVDGYSGTDAVESGSEAEIRDKWSDGGNGRGEWIMTLTAVINNPPSPLGNIVDSDEDYTIRWNATWFQLEMSPKAEGQV